MFRILLITALTILFTCITEALFAMLYTGEPDPYLFISPFALNSFLISVPVLVCVVVYNFFLQKKFPGLPPFIKTGINWLLLWMILECAIAFWILTDIGMGYLDLDFTIAGFMTQYKNNYFYLSVACILSPLFMIQLHKTLQKTV